MQKIAWTQCVSRDHMEEGIAWKEGSQGSKGCNGSNRRFAKGHEIYI
jgi:hypothetical protein